MSKPWTDKETEELKNLRKAGKTIQEIAETLHRSYDSVTNRNKILGLPKTIPAPYDAFPAKVNPKHPPLALDVKLDPPAFGYLPLDFTDNGDWIRLGLVGDTHLACKEERLDALHNQYDIFEKEGITDVLHAGNIVDGYIPKINGGSVFETSVDGQVQYVIDNYPQRKGIITHYITGDDHEGWWMKEGFNFGHYLHLVAINQDRKDLNYIGHVEADVEIKTGKVSTMVRVCHPGGGSAYSRSYTGQKMVESFQGGEKPEILVAGHYHVSNMMNDRNIYVINLPGFQDQTIFARKKRLRMEVGGALLEFKVNPRDGSVTRCRVEFNMFFDRGYYKAYLKSDKKALKGHLVLKR